MEKCHFNLEELQKRCPLPKGWSQEKAAALYVFTVRLYEEVKRFLFIQRDNSYLLLQNNKLILLEEPKKGENNLVDGVARKYKLPKEDVVAYLNFIGVRIKKGWDITDWWLEVNNSKPQQSTPNPRKNDLFGNLSEV